ncbi:hypothetical protein DIURU_004537 [Diutina rugosa]|uniref:Post-GPI attachment to proteins factor 3 n=1 Tax=Diutina rugosa TaxID=5481 RepID=A0A642UGT2_DIURU|nr:uncharacterized protein DIURU_004537 [Diutina rugosa]KAA8898693.1 hypothetical protein DIURU_004537 [Diutina rugosa]
MRWPIALVLSLVAMVSVEASAGDNLDEMDFCKGQCWHMACAHYDYRDDHPEWPYTAHWSFTEEPLPRYLQLLGWDCEANCDYECQRIITAERRAENLEVLQFHGKWPFLRVFGCQELASVVFSVGNFIVQFLGLYQIINAIKKYPTPWIYYCDVMGVALVSMAAWAFSTIFHIRDTEQTEKLDYYFAGLTVLSSAHAIGARFWRLYRPQNRLGRWIWLGVCVAAYANHIHRLETDWSYTYNMQANIAVGIIQNVLLILLLYQIYSEYYEKEQVDKKPSKNHLKYLGDRPTILGSFYTYSAKLYSIYPGLLAAIVAFGILFEVFDFSPIFYDLIDAHALWHLITIIPVWCGWYNWMIWDINENVWPDVQAQLAKKTQ